MTRDERWLLEEKYGGIATPEFTADCARLALGEPVAYVIGWQPFLGLKVFLDSHPLIPRPETEHWVEDMTSTIHERARGHFRGVPQGDGARHSDFSAEKYATPEGAAGLRALDLCAGSGAIGCAVMKAFPTAYVSFGEIDTHYEATLHRNVRENGLDELRADIRIGDLFEPFADETFDIIAANPPYIPAARTLPASVADYEPALALRAGTDGLALLRRIALQLPRHLAKGGQAWIECDSAHAETARGLFEAAGFSAAVRLDQYGRPRVLVVSWSN